MVCTYCLANVEIDPYNNFDEIVACPNCGCKSRLSGDEINDGDSYFWDYRLERAEDRVVILQPANSSADAATETIVVNADRLRHDFRISSSQELF
jgi:hypothetical protein